jgi:hypothetical protein
MDPQTHPMKTIKHLLIVILLTIALAEVAVRVLTVRNGHAEYFAGKVWRYMLPIKYDRTSSDFDAPRKNGYRMYDSLLGWSHGSWQQDDSLYYSDGLGFRCGRDRFEQRQPAPERYDIACIGNSFTHGDAVAYEDTWPHMLAQATGRTVLNMGVGGYGIDQAILRFMHRRPACDTVILGMVSNDLDRSLTSVYNYYQGGVKTKPKFKFNDSGYAVINQPCLTPAEFLQRPATPNAIEVYREIDGYNDYLGKETKWWTNLQSMRLLFSSIEQMKHRKPSAYLSDDERLQYCVRILDVFVKYCRQEGITPVVLMIDNVNSINDREKTGKNTWGLLSSKLDSIGLKHLECQDEAIARYRRRPSDLIHPVEQVHYSPAGHRFLADFIQKRL